MFNRVELSATRFCVATKTPTGVIVAARLDLQFSADKEYPNQWREIDRGAAAQIVLGKPQPYSGAAFYAKVMRSAAPKEAIFVEFDEVFYEPQDWFGPADVNLMPAELKKIIPFEIKTFRGKLARATLDAKAKKADEGAEKKVR